MSEPAADALFLGGRFAFLGTAREHATPQHDQHFANRDHFVDQWHNIRCWHERHPEREIQMTLGFGSRANGHLEVPCKVP